MPYTISVSDGSASLLKNGWINITKNNSVGTPLAGAEFTLFAMDGTTAIKQGVTGADGTLKLKVIPDGSYILRETQAPSGFALEGVDHSLVVTTSGSTVTSSIDGQTGENANDHNDRQQFHQRERPPAVALDRDGSWGAHGSANPALRLGLAPKLLFEPFAQPLFDHALVIQEPGPGEALDAGQHPRIEPERDRNGVGNFIGRSDRRFHQPQVDPGHRPEIRLGGVVIEERDFFPSGYGIHG